MLLSTAAWIGGLTALMSARPAEAFRLYQMNPEGGVGLIYANRCGPGSDHAALRTQLQAQLAGDPSATTLTVTCPICGCPVTVNR